MHRMTTATRIFKIRCATSRATQTKKLRPFIIRNTFVPVFEILDTSGAHIKQWGMMIPPYRKRNGIFFHC
jgi:hypothetical protein